MNGSDGSITTGTYDSFGHVFTATSPGPEQSRELRELQQQLQLKQQRQQVNQDSYEAGQRIGQGIGNAIGTAIEAHRVTRYCKDHPTESYRTSDGFGGLCPHAPLGESEIKSVGEFCEENPGGYVLIGRRKVDCDTPPDPPTLKWAKWELNTWQLDFRNQGRTSTQTSGDLIKRNWTYWRDTYCRLSPNGTTYKDNENTKQSCKNN